MDCNDCCVCPLLTVYVFVDNCYIYILPHSKTNIYCIWFDVFFRVAEKITYFCSKRDKKSEIVLCVLHIVTKHTLFFYGTEKVNELI